MTVSLSPSPAALPATVSVPADGELVNSASLIQFAQVLLNALGYDLQVTGVLHNGGALNPTGGLTVKTGGELILQSLNNFSIQLNGANIDPDGNIATAGGLTSYGPTILAGPTNIAALVRPIAYAVDGTDAGRVPRRAILGADVGTSSGSPQIFEPAVVDKIIWPPGTLSTSRHWKISEATLSSVDGDWCSLYNGDAGSNTITIYNPAGTPMGVIGSSVPNASVYRIAGTWYWGGAS